MSIRNATRNRFGGIDAEFNHPRYGWIAISLHPDDPPTATMYAACVAGDFGAVADYVLPLSSAQSEKVTELTAAYQAAITADISYLGYTFQADEESQALLVKATGAGATYAPPFWQDKDNVPHTMDFATLIGLYGAMLLRGTEAFVNLQTKKAAVRVATTVQQVEAITWTFQAL